jgi:two-component system, NtrC family, nitrogen regulation sensor histidine kinase GlnL
MSKHLTKTNHILENLNTVVILLSSDLRILYANPSAEMFFSLSLDRMHNRPASTILYHNNIFKKLNDSIQSGRTFSEREVSIQVQQQDSIVDMSITPLISTVNNKIKTKEILLEITPQDRHLKISREEMLFSQQQISRELLRSMAHEVKNPLGGIRGAAQLLEQEFEPAINESERLNELKEYTQVIIGEADRLKNLVDRMTGPKTKANKQWINIHSVTERVRTLMLADNELIVPIYFDYDPSIPDIYADSEQLIQAVLNLIKNAAQSITECKNCKDKKITIKTRIKRHYTIGPSYYNLVLKLDIIDTGPGIKSNILEHIFMPLITGRANGTGLGLSIAQSLLSQNKGLIECESEPGNTIFTVLLPILKKESIEKKGAN